MRLGYGRRLLALFLERSRISKQLKKGQEETGFESAMPNDILSRKQKKEKKVSQRRSLSLAYERV